MLLSLFSEKFLAGEAVFLLLACWATWMAGRAVALSWQNEVTFLVYSLLLAGGVRFLHHALYQGPFLSVTHYLSDLVLLAIIGLVAFRYTRTNQMVSQYSWLYEKVSPLSWRSKAG
jgi:hypothetical protein